jgi:hypothetical protein
VCRRGTCDREIWRKPLAGCGGCGAYLWDFNRFSPGKPCQKRDSAKKQLLMVIDLATGCAPQSSVFAMVRIGFPPFSVDGKC